MSSLVTRHIEFFSKPIWLKIVCMRLRKSNPCPRLNLGFPQFMISNGFPSVLISFSPELANQISSSWPCSPLAGAHHASFSSIASSLWKSSCYFFLYLPVPLQSFDHFPLYRKTSSQCNYLVKKLTDKESKYSRSGAEYAIKQPCWLCQENALCSLSVQWEYM